MKIALYNRHLEAADAASLDSLIQSLRSHGIEICRLAEGDSIKGCDFLFSVGGDGTLLSSVQLLTHLDNQSARQSHIPILGINFGHLGFLTTVGRDHLDRLADNILNGHYTLEQRTLLQGEYCGTPFLSLNEVFLHRCEEASLLRTEVCVDNHYVATYAGDGIIVATPTGSTAYSLSCGGPILTPDSRCLLITPISAHTLTLRPIIVPDTATVTLHVCDDCFLGRDSQRSTLAGGTDITLRCAPFTISLVRMGDQDFFSAIRDKLMWGTEIRP